MPENFDHTWAEAHHLMVTVDANQDDLLTKAATNLKFIFFKEKVSSFPSECLVSDIPAGDGKTFFYSVGYENMSSRVQ